MRRLGLTLAAAVALGLIVLCACGGGGGGGGGSSYNVSIEGPNYVGPLSKTTFTCVVKSGEAKSIAWSIEGSGTIVGPIDQQSVVVLAKAGSLGGKYTLYLSVQGDNWGSSIHKRLEVQPYPRFKVVINNPSGFGQSEFYGNTATVNLKLTADGALGTTYRVSFYGTTSHLPDQVPVTITTTQGPVAALNWWLGEFVSSQTLKFPLRGGGTVGAGGSVLDTGDNRPELSVFGTGSAGSVRFSAPGVRTMVINITR